MKKLNFAFPIIVIGIAILLGFYMNYRNGMDWPSNVSNMSNPEKLMTYLGLLVVIFIWKNRGQFKKD